MTSSDTGTLPTDSFQKQWKHLRRTLRSLPAKSPDEIDDLIQEAAILVIRQGKDPVRWLGWIAAIVRRWVTFGRGPKPYVQLQENHLISKPQAKLHNSIAIKEVLQKLTPAQQDIIYAYFYEEKTLKEIAKERGVSFQAVHLILTRALVQMRKYLTQ